MNSNFVPVSKDLFFSKGDPNDPRMGDRVSQTIQEITPTDCVILGYPDDQGIKLNGGRMGANEAPDVIRRQFYKMTSLSEVPLFDGGNLNITNNLTMNHDNALENVLNYLRLGARIITLGGGHDYGYPDMSAFCQWALQEGKRPAVINFDAHLDVRPTDKGFHSGTPFFRLLEKFGDKIDFFEVGIQPWCNSQKHLKWAIERGAHILNWEEIQSSGLSFSEVFQRQILERLSKKSALALSIDIDGFSSHFAPGASQVFPTGLDANAFMTLWPLLHHWKPQIMGIYEVSPPLDIDNRTSRLAAILMHRFLAPSNF